MKYLTRYKMEGIDVSLEERLSLQLSELEILSSMFVDGKELSVDQDSLLAIQDYLSRDHVSGKPSQRLSFTISLATSSSSSSDFTGKTNHDVLDVNCCLPHSYPQEQPEINVKCNGLTRELQKELNDKTKSFLSSLDLGELCIVTLVQWLQENWPDFYERSRLQVEHKETERGEVDQPKADVNLSRLWLYMHHIYNKNKRKNILEWAAQYKLTGFSLPGKPGVVCIEGDVRDTEEYFSRLRQLNWKKITCRHRETELTERKFENFHELVFHVHGSGDDRMSMGEFFQYLVKHDLGEMFKMLFGIEGK